MAHNDQTIPRPTAALEFNGWMLAALRADRRSLLLNLPDRGCGKLKCSAEATNASTLQAIAAGEMAHGA